MPVSSQATVARRSSSRSNDSEAQTAEVMAASSAENPMLRQRREDDSEEGPEPAVPEVRNRHRNLTSGDENNWFFSYSNW